MQFSKNWLKDFIEINVSTEELCDQLTMLGLEVESHREYRSKVTGKDDIIKLDITPNRGDCFSILGIARELSALKGSKLSYPKFKQIKQKVHSPINVRVCKEAPYYAGRYIDQVDLTKKTPQLIKERLKLSDIRVIVPIVDITNYVLLELGQPLHAFDSKKISENLTVRFSKKGEKITLLDEQVLDLGKDFLVIADENNPVALAGIMGGFSSGVTNKTKSIYLESAFFLPEVIRGKARKLGIQTEASLRFERGVDFQLQTLAINRASFLINEVTGGRFGPVQLFTNKNSLPKRKLVSFSPSKVNSLLGSEIKHSHMKNLLKVLGMQIQSSKSPEKIKVRSPSWRFDLEVEADLIEEIARLVGYDKLPKKTNKNRQLIKTDFLHESLRSSFKSLGFNEVINYSFIETEEALLTSKPSNIVIVENPISQNMSVMRPSMFTGLLKNFSYNYNRGIDRLKIYEIGSVFNNKNKTKISEKVLVSGLVSGPRYSLDWKGSNEEMDFFDLKGDIETVFSNFSFKKSSLSYLHPGKTASIFKGKRLMGYLGSVGPHIKEKFDLKQEVLFFEISIDAFNTPSNIKFKNFSLFPVAQRDLNFVLDSEIPSTVVRDLIIKKGGKYLKYINIFDLYEGKGIPKGKKSLAFSIAWQAKYKTMTDSEIDKIVEEIVSFLSNEVDAKLRT